MVHQYKIDGDRQAAAQRLRDLIKVQEYHLLSHEFPLVVIKMDTTIAGNNAPLLASFFETQQLFILDYAREGLVRYLQENRDSLAGLTEMDQFRGLGAGAFETVKNIRITILREPLFQTYWYVYHPLDSDSQ